MYGGTYLTSMPASSHTDHGVNDDSFRPWRRSLSGTNTMNQSGAGGRRDSSPNKHSPLPISSADLDPTNNTGSLNYSHAGGQLPSISISQSPYSHNRGLSVNSIPSSLPPPPPSTSATSPTIPIYRKHSRKRSSQVLVPPIQVSRRRSVRQSSSSEISPESAGPTSGISKGDSLNITEKRSSFVESKSDKDYSSSDDETRNNVLKSTPEMTQDEFEKIQDKENKVVDDDEIDEVDEDEDENDDQTYIDGLGRSRKSVVTPTTLASGATLLIGAQFFSKILTFTLNQALLRFVSPDLLGVNAQFELFTNTILFFSREAVRLATQRQTLVGKSQDVYRFEGGVAHGTHSGTIQEVINIGFVPLFVGIPLAAIISFIYYYTWAGSLDQDYIGTAIIILAISSIIELACEPSFLLSQLSLDFKTRASIESAAITSRCLVTFIFVLISRRTWGPTIVLFAFGQLAYSTVNSGLYFLNGLKTSRHQQYQLLYLQGIWKETGTNQEKIYFNPDTKTLAVGMWLQTIFKHLLTEGDKLLVSLVLPITEQGVYALVANYGSLIARLGFLPVEEALRSFFSKLLATSDVNEGSVGNNDIVEASNSPSLRKFTPPSTSPQLVDKNEKTNSKIKPSDLTLSVIILSTILRFYTYLDIIVCIFGPLAAPYILSILVSSAWLSTDAPKVLATYACYIPFLAINGCLEAFVQSVATVEDLKDQGRVMVIFSVSFAIAGYVFMVLMDLGAQGLIFANMLNMTLRIGWCTRFISVFYSSNPLPKDANNGSFLSTNWTWLQLAIPHKVVLAASVVAAGVAWRLGTINSYQDLIKQGGIGMCLVGVILFYERDLILQSMNKLKKKPIHKS